MDVPLVSIVCRRNPGKKSILSSLTNSQAYCAAHAPCDKVVRGGCKDRPSSRLGLTRKSIAPGSGTSIASGQYACEEKIMIRVFLDRLYLFSGYLAGLFLIAI